MEKHTPTPWRASIRGDAIVADEPTSQHGDNNAKELQHYGGYVIAESLTDEDRAFALRACNSHDELVGALKAILETKPQFGMNPRAIVGSPDAVGWNVHAMARAAIAAAGAA